MKLADKKRKQYYRDIFSFSRLIYGRSDNPNQFSLTCRHRHFDGWSS